MNRSEPGLRVGCRVLEVNDAVQDARIPVRLLYPTRSEERSVRFGPYEISAAKDAPMEGNGCPLVIISHGGGGSGLTYRGLASHLARAGFVVVLPEHPGDNRSDRGLKGTAANLENRPRHIRLALDAAFADATVGTQISSEKVAVIGHSMGGYTALAVAGGRPFGGPHETADGQIRPVSVWPDPRVRALVLLAPACVWFWSDGALADVAVPILMLTAEKDELASHLHVDLVQRVGDRARLEHREIPNAGHHAFQSPFPPEMARPDFAPARDPEGFDRAAFQPILYADVLSFLRGAL
jgi:predicted dienelactone hydrolase